MEYEEACELMKKNNSISVLVETEENDFKDSFSISECNLEGGYCDCCSNYDMDKVKVLRVVNLETMEILFDGVEK